MILRLYAMFERRKSILIFTLSSLALVLVSEGVLISFAIRTTLHNASTEPHYSYIPTEYCDTLNGWKFSYLFWVPLLVSEIILFMLSLYKGYKGVFQNRRDHCGHFGERCLSILIKDSILYFLAMFTVYLIIMILWVIPDRHVLAVPIDFHPALAMAIAQRLILNIRSHCAKQSGLLSDVEDVGTWFGGDGAESEDSESCYPEDRACELEFAHHYNVELSRIDTEGIVQESEAGETEHY